jgi:acyl-CoA reductase-like NAD-dependent aldehyde dehydrogenase
VLGSIAALLPDYPFEEELGNSLLVREPIGVVGAITPWNYPLHQVVAKVAPALGAGCTIVLKPSELASLSALLFAEIVDEAGLPAGVFNLVPGTGPVVGEAIAAHPGIDMVSFTGSTRAGSRVSELASGTIKRVALELGGKSANLVFADADLERAAAAAPSAVFGNAGQDCCARSRILVEQSVLDPFMEASRRRSRRCGWAIPWTTRPRWARSSPRTSAPPCRRSSTARRRWRSAARRRTDPGSGSPHGALPGGQRRPGGDRGDLRPGGGGDPVP